RGERSAAGREIAVRRARSSTARATHDGWPKSVQKNRRRPTLPGPCEPSTIGAEGLNCSVRNGKRCFPLAMTTGKAREAEPPRSLKTAQPPHRVSQEKSVKPSTH